MRILYLFFLLLGLSCTKPSETDTPNLPQPPAPENPPPAPPPPDPVYSFGKLFVFKDSLKVYNANTGELVVVSAGHGLLRASGFNNTTVDDSLVYQPTITRLLAMNARTGKVHFLKYFSYVFYSFGGVSPSLPIINGSRLFMVAYNSQGAYKLFCLDKTTGAVIWESAEALSYDQNPHLPSPAQTNDNLLVNTYDGVACFEKASGKLVWRNNTNREFDAIDGRAIVVKNEKYITTSWKYNAAYCFDARTGSLLWKTPLATGVDVLPREPYARNNTLYITSRKNSYDSKGYLVNCIDVATGHYLKALDYPEAMNVFYGGDHFFTTNRVSVGFLPQRLNKHLLSTGNIVWQKDLEGGVWNGLTITPEFLYCTEAELNNSTWQRMAILRQEDGARLKTFPLYAASNVLCVVQDSLGRVYGTNH